MTIGAVNLHVYNLFSPTEIAIICSIGISGSLTPVKIHEMIKEDLKIYIDSSDVEMFADGLADRGWLTAEEPTDDSDGNVRYQVTELSESIFYNSEDSIYSHFVKLKDKIKELSEN